MNVWTTQSTEDASSILVPNTTECSPPLSRASDSAMMGQRPSPQVAAVNSRNECDLGDFPPSAVPGQVAEDSRDQRSSPKPPGTAHDAFDATKECSTPNIVLFRKSPSYFANFTLSRFVVGSVEYSCGEQFFAAGNTRLFDDQVALRKIYVSNIPICTSSWVESYVGSMTTNGNASAKTFILLGTATKFSPKPDLSTLFGTSAFVPTIRQREIRLRSAAQICWVKPYKRCAAYSSTTRHCLMTRAAFRLAHLPGRLAQRFRLNVAGVGLGQSQPLRETKRIRLSV